LKLKKERLETAENLGNVSANFKSVICVFTCVVHAKQLVQNAVNILAVNLFNEVL
jgi:hypothetical protein